MILILSYFVWNFVWNIYGIDFTLYYYYMYLLKCKETDFTQTNIAPHKTKHASMKTNNAYLILHKMLDYTNF
jgi:hypothetical protein